MSKRDDIIASALDIISERGISELTLPVLFKHAHTGAGTFYHYFDDRGVLIDGVFEYCFDTVNDALADLWESKKPARERFDEAMDRLTGLYLTNPKEMKFLYSFTYGYVMPDRDFCRVIPSVALINSIVIQAKQEGLASDSATPMALSRAIRAMLSSIYTGYERGEYEFDRESVQRFAKCAWAVIEA